MDRDPASFRVASSFHRVIQAAATAHDADIVLIDVGPNLGAINRSALISAEFVATPLGADLFSIQGLRNLGPTLVRWRDEWKERLAKNPVTGLELPPGVIQPIGYIVMQPNLYGGHVTQAYARWLHEIPIVYKEAVLRERAESNLTIGVDPCCLAILRHYRSLMPMAQAAQKPIFKLTAGDGAIGAHSQAVQKVGNEFRDLARKLSGRMSASAAKAS
jgi:cellulose biosynthesis protein BcsQ